MAKAINPLGFIDLTSPEKQKESLDRVKTVLWTEIWSILNWCAVIGIILLGGNIFSWYHIRNPESQIILTTSSLAIFAPFFLRFLKLFNEYKQNEKRLKNEDQKEQARSYITLAKSLGSKVFRLKTNDLRVTDLGTEMTGFFKSFTWSVTNDQHFEIEVQF